jgi:hypothetical protein
MLEARESLQSIRRKTAADMGLGRFVERLNDGVVESRPDLLDR